MDDPSYIELTTSKDHWTLIRRILKSFNCYIYMSNNRKGMPFPSKRKGIGCNQSSQNKKKIFDRTLNITANVHPKATKSLC